jgi:hypothetical protein
MAATLHRGKLYALFTLTSTSPRAGQFFTRRHAASSNPDSNPNDDRHEALDGVGGDQQVCRTGRMSGCGGGFTPCNCLHTAARRQNIVNITSVDPLSFPAQLGRISRINARAPTALASAQAPSASKLRRYARMREMSGRENRPAVSGLGKLRRAMPDLVGGVRQLRCLLAQFLSLRRGVVHLTLPCDPAARE